MPDAFAAPGMVIAQNPTANASGVERPSVSLLVATEPAETSEGFVMPDLSGQMLSAAESAITRAGLKLAPVKEQPVPIPGVGAVDAMTAPAAPVLPGSILAQRPAPGHRVDASMPIELTVAQ
jgi:beta-lactam-binding protein with PASTA domain